jgi:large subunit ribosomal protein L22
VSRTSKKRRGEPEVVSRARLRYLRGSAQKARLVVDQIRGKRVDEAGDLLKASPRRAARHVYKVLMSALANTENAPDAAMIDTDDLQVVRAWVDEGPFMKRIRPAPMGRAFPIHKRTCHVTLELGTYPRRRAAAD